MGACLLQERQAEPRAGAAPLWGCAARLVQLTPPVKGARRLFHLPFLYLLQQEDELPARKLDALILQLDTLAKTTLGSPVLR